MTVNIKNAKREVLPQTFPGDPNTISEVKNVNPVKVVLTLIPFIWTIGMLPFVNRVKPLVLGLPFVAFWLIAGIFVAFLCIGALYRIDKNNQDS